MDPDATPDSNDGPFSTLNGRYLTTTRVTAPIPHKTDGLFTGQISVDVEIRSDHPLFPLLQIAKDEPMARMRLAVYILQALS